MDLCCDRRGVFRAGLVGLSRSRVARRERFIDPLVGQRQDLVDLDFSRITIARGMPVDHTETS